MPHVPSFTPQCEHGLKTSLQCSPHVAAVPTEAVPSFEFCIRWNLVARNWDPFGNQTAIERERLCEIVGRLRCSIFLRLTLTQKKKKKKRKKGERFGCSSSDRSVWLRSSRAKLCGIRCAAVAAVFLFGCERLAPIFVGFGFTATEERSRAREMPQMNDPFALQVCVERPWPGRLLLLLPPIALCCKLPVFFSAQWGGEPTLVQDWFCCYLE